MAKNGLSVWRRWQLWRPSARWDGTRCGRWSWPRSTPVYAQYTVETGDIETSMSLSGAIELVNSESFSASERTTVQEVYVEADQTVSAGDELLRLANGETFAASIDGTVTTLNVARGDAVWPQMSLVTVADLSDLRVSTSVDEYDVRTVAAGAAVRGDGGFPGADLRDGNRPCGPRLRFRRARWRVTR